MIREAIQKELARRGWSQSELARRVGWKSQHLCRYLSGARDIHAEAAAELLQALGIKLAPPKK